MVMLDKMLCKCNCTLLCLLLHDASTYINCIPLLSVRESYTHALSGNTKYFTIDGQVCFHRRLLPML